jgi:O-antigen ligase
VASFSRQAVVPVYLFACLILGGSAQGAWSNMLLQLAGVGLIAWAAMTRGGEPLTHPAKQLLALAIVAVTVVTLQLVPLPPSIWPQLGGRRAIAQEFGLLGIEVPAFSLSLTPFRTFATLLTLIPPLAVLCAMCRMHAHRPGGLVAALVLGTFAGVLLGILQVTSPDPLTSPWYLYEQVNWGAATGFFANANHMATLLLMCLPFLAALLASARGGNVQRYSAVLAIVAGAAVVVIIGIVLNGSLAGYVLAVPVIVASAMLIIPPGRSARPWIGLAAGVSMVVGVGFLWMRPVSSSLGVQAATSVHSRAEMVATTLTAARDFLPFGSGVGSFRNVYPLFENPDSIVPTVVNHAHNDYAELLLETGVAGALLIAAFLAWWVAAALRVWSDRGEGHFARAASIASAIILVHSLVDYPLRTAAISAGFAMSLALMAQRRAPATVEKTDLRPARHIAFS